MPTKQKAQPTTQERVAVYDKVSFAQVIAKAERDSRPALATVESYIAAIRNSPKTADLSGLTNQDTYNFRIMLDRVFRLVQQLKLVHFANIDRVREEDEAAERVRLAAIAAKEKAAKEKQTRLERLREIRALEAEFPEEK